MVLSGNLRTFEMQVVVYHLQSSMTQYLLSKNIRTSIVNFLKTWGSLLFALFAVGIAFYAIQVDKSHFLQSMQYQKELTYNVT